MVVRDGRQIEEFVFNDQTFGPDEFSNPIYDESVTIFGTDGDDDLTGTSGENLITGGLGDDILRGGDASDQYFYSAGDGADTFVEVDREVDIIFVTGYTASDATLERDPDDAVSIIVRFSETDSLRLVNGAGQDIFNNGLFFNGVERIEFEDGSFLDTIDLVQSVLDQTATDGSDNIVGFTTNDEIAGGPGDDVLNGAIGNDTFVYRPGDGADSIIDAIGENVIRIEGYSSNDLDVVRDAGDTNDIFLVFGTSGDQIRITPDIADIGNNSGLQSDEYFENIVVTFDDASLTYNDLIERLNSAYDSDASLTVRGLQFGETYRLGGGDDTVIDVSGNDTYILSLIHI